MQTGETMKTRRRERFRHIHQKKKFIIIGKEKEKRKSAQ